MIEQLSESSGSILGFRVSGDVGREDYDVLVPAVLAAVEEHGSVRLLLDMRDFRWERVTAWGRDLSFGRTFHDEVDRLAVVGHGLLGKTVAAVGAPFYARQADYFEEPEEAWAWVRS